MYTQHTQEPFVGGKATVITLEKPRPTREQENRQERQERQERERKRQRKLQKELELERKLQKDLELEPSFASVMCGFFVVGYDGEEEKYLQNILNWKTTQGVTPIIVTNSHLKGLDDANKWKKLAMERNFSYLDLSTFNIPILNWYLDQTVNIDPRIRIPFYTDFCRWYMLKILRHMHIDVDVVMICQASYLTTQKPWLTTLINKTDNDSKTIILGKDRGVIIQMKGSNTIELVTIAYNQLYSMFYSKGWLQPTNDQFFDQLFITVATKGRKIRLADLKETYGNKTVIIQKNVDDMLSGKKGESPIFWKNISNMQYALTQSNPLGAYHNDVYKSFGFKREYFNEVGYGQNSNAVVYRMTKTDSHWSEVGIKIYFAEKKRREEVSKKTNKKRRQINMTNI
tara:strand:- start:80 stop:1276 length:1197 start_codon:yes stop_codon:yes gene_type:complete